MAAVDDLVWRNAAQIADVADVLGDAEIRIEAERLREVAGLEAGLARRAAEDFAEPALASMTPARI